MPIGKGNHPGTHGPTYGSTLGKQAAKSKSLSKDIEDRRADTPDSTGKGMYNPPKPKMGHDPNTGEYGQTESDPKYMRRAAEDLASRTTSYGSYVARKEYEKKIKK
jgi:hypothetical protein